MPADRMFHKRLGHSQKVSALTDFEYRVWSQYQLSADDFGVMRKSAVQLQADNDNLAKRSATTIHRALKHLVEVGLLVRFDHQLQSYVCQRDWQDFQKVTYPSKTINPKPPADLIATFSEQTRELFELHPGARKLLTKKNSEKTSEELLENSGKTSETFSSPRACAPAKRLTANGSGLTAHGLEGGAGGTAPLDLWLRELQDSRYPSRRVTRNHITSTAFVDAMLGYPEGPHAAWALLCANLAANIASHEWRVRGYVPKLENYLRDGLWRNDPHPVNAPAAEQLTAKTNRTLSAAAEILGERRPA